MMKRQTHLCILNVLLILGHVLYEGNIHKPHHAKKKKKVPSFIQRSWLVHNQHTITPDLCTWDDLNPWKSVDGVRCMEYVRNEAQWGVPFKESFPYCGQLKGIIRHILWSLSKENKKKNNINVYFHAVWHQAIVLHKQWLCFRYSIRCFNIAIYVVHYPSKSDGLYMWLVNRRYVHSAHGCQWLTLC